MINFFRKDRLQMLSKNKFSKYLLYAIGEIVLVVIGILIAIQINNWKQLNVENKLERKYLNNLITELKQDSIGLKNNYLKLERQARTKSLFLDMVKGKIQTDSIIEYFEYQWQPIQPYVPIKSTYIEMSANSHLRIIRDDMIRERIIKFYNSYEALEKEEDFLTQTSTENVLNMISERLPDMSNYSIDDIMSLRHDTHLLNTIQLNGAYTRRDNYKKTITDCSTLIAHIKEYQSTLN
ncbi:DUF6090 family protein [Roseivirga echinicomitans]|uniref:Uncharacterized protein n=1 Tax=Roseivirga echinicomitans TaxID=296218 RepID=A0A150XCM8_9BACT|nr:DUF6090 family protein [Roseivirga echinicomitans]KYG76468.1 hypothetical protein AWN68_05385 [Roseivirga echinicomitans]